MQKRIVLISIVLMALTGCVRIPVQSIELTDALQAEGERMHRLNIALLNNMFNDKKKDIDKFVQEQYAPAMIKNFVSIVPENTDFKARFGDMVNALSPRINARKDSLLGALETQRDKLTNKLNADYAVFVNATGELKKLLESAVKVDKEKASMFGKVKELSKNSLDLTSVQNALETFVRNAGSAGDKISTLQTTLDPLINK